VFLPDPPVTLETLQIRPLDTAAHRMSATIRQTKKNIVRAKKREALHAERQLRGEYPDDYDD